LHSENKSDYASSCARCVGGEIVVGDAHGHVLVVEDEAAFRCVVVRILTEAGYRVSEADGLEPAIALVERDLSIDLLLTDIGMGPGNPQGISIARMSQYRRIGLKVVYMTGGDAIAISMLANGAQVLQKPFAREVLLKAVQTAMPLQRRDPSQ
jgi:DNA-binding NtrC family response regulator